MTASTYLGMRRLSPGVDGAGPPAPPIDAGTAVDEGPARRELRRQIALLEHDRQQIVLATCPWTAPAAATGRSGPRLLSAADLVVVRDELLAAIEELRATPRDA